jgi:hypothetical protein
MEYPSNSKKVHQQKPQPEKPKFERIVEGKVIKQKKPFGRRLKETLIGGDGVRSVWGFVAHEVLIPSFRDMVADAGYETINRAMYGDSARPSQRRSRYNTGGVPGRVNYQAQSQQSSYRQDPRREMSRQARAMHNFDEIILASRPEAELVMQQMFNSIEQYGVVTVSDLKEMLGVTPDFTDEKWGWADISGLGTTRVRNGWLLDLPRPEPLGQ